jgi:hypothetical protein
MATMAEYEGLRAERERTPQGPPPQTVIHKCQSVTYGGWIVTEERGER